MCNSPMYYVKVVDRNCLPPEFIKRIKKDGFICGRSEYTYLRDVVGYPQYLITTIPCGKCLGCKVDYQNQWSTRIQLECSQYEDNYFITLTYSDEFIYKRLVIDTVTGKTCFYNELVKKDFTAFIKRLRRLLDYRGLDKIRFLCAGELGDNGLRPHFHFIGCNLKLPDLQYFYSKGKKGAWKLDYNAGDEVYYRSAIIEKAWGKGFCLVARVIPENCSYVASYVNKKVTPSEIRNSLTASTFYEISRDFGKPCCALKLCSIGSLTSPFLHMSRRNGLAFNIFDENEQAYYFSNDSIKPRKNVKLFKKRLRYFDNIFKKNDEELFALFREKRKLENPVKPTGYWSTKEFDEMEKREELLKIKAKKKKKREL